MGYDPVMSESGDIFYELGKHVQDACREEVVRCNMFVLVVGNNYGSIYHEHTDSGDVPDSVTLQEFRKALEVGVPKFIFVNRFVRHDFDNYQRALAKEYAKYFTVNDVPSSHVEETKMRIKRRFDKSYPFPQDAYPFVFYFLEEIDSLGSNNAIMAFESFDDIRSLLKKQWAGLVYESLEREKQVPVERLELLAEKLDTIEKQIRALLSSRTEDRDQEQATFDLEKLYREFATEDFEKLQNRISDLLIEMIYDDDAEQQRINFDKKWTQAEALDWLKSLAPVVRKYKWSKAISVTDLFSGRKITYWKGCMDVGYREVFDLSAIFDRFSKEDQEALARSVASQFNRFFEEPSSEPQDDDIPF
jgi:hypothetical protein